MKKFILCEIKGEFSKNEKIEFGSGASLLLNPFDYEEIESFKTFEEAEKALNEKNKDYISRRNSVVEIREHFIKTTDDDNDILDLFCGSGLDNFIQNKIIETLKDAERNGDSLGNENQIVKDFLNGNLLGFRLKEEFKDFILKSL